MENKTTTSSQNDKKLITLGFIAIAILFLIYSRFENPSLTPDALSSIERLSVMFYVLIIISFSIIGVGLRKYQKRKAIEPSQNPLTIICSVTVNLKGISYGNELYVVVGASGTIITSSDGTSWTERTSVTTNQLNAVTFSE